MKTCKLGIIGLGTVGGGTLQLLQQKAKYFQTQYGLDLQIKAVAAKSPQEWSGFNLDNITCTTQPLSLCQDPNLDLIVELAGGYEAPRLWIQTALENGKHVVTANKALLAKYGHELFPLASKNKKILAFEASVGGGIPIIKSLQVSLAANQIQKLACIINGTCNYILTEMSQKGLDFAPTLKNAQELGYAEANPSFDIDGIDSAHKVAILASLCSKKWLSFENMGIEGITKINMTDVAMAKELGYAIKLLGVTQPTDQGVAAHVYPALIPLNHPLSQIHGVLNAVFVNASEVGPMLFTGAGAGRKATASAVVADILGVSQFIDQDPPKMFDMGFYNQNNPAEQIPLDNLEMEFYLRLSVQDIPGVLAKITAELANANISISALHQKTADSLGNASIIIITHKTSNKNVLNALKAIDQQNFIVEPTQLLRFFEP